MQKLKKRLVFVTLFLLSIIQVSAVIQQEPIRIAGKVVDGNGDALIGVTVRVKESNVGAVTDMDGNFVIQASPSSTLILTYVGFANQEVKVDPSGVMNITMRESDELLDEVVVVGYGTMRKKDLTGGLAVVGKEQLDMVSTSNLMDRLVGQVAGLNITTSNAAPGSDQSILIRGENSISASNSPLIVLDGIPYSGGLVDLDPNIIESLSVLKDASAVAIYGSRGSNGVILIQTKRGVVGKAQVAYRGQVGFSEPMQKLSDVYHW